MTKCMSFIKRFERSQAQSNNRADESEDEEEDELALEKAENDAVKDENSNSVPMGSEGDDSISEYEVYLQRKKVIKLNKRKKRRVVRNSILRFVAVVLLVQFYSLISFFLLFYSQSQYSRTFSTFLTFARQRLFLRVYVNANIQLFLDPKVPVFGQDPWDYARGKLSELYDITPDQADFEKHISDFDSNLVDVYNRAFYGNSCAVITDTTNRCPKLLEASLTLGIYNVYHYLFDFFRTRQELWRTGQRNGTNVLGSLEFAEIGYVVYNQIEAVFGYYFRSTANVVIDQTSLYSRILSFSLAAYIITVIIIFLLWLFPNITRYNNELWRTTAMLKMIPFTVIIKIPKIRDYLLLLIREHERDSITD
eukprot:TRINITY_DN5864_c0_g1_i5.p1 TRINITY_DN5864_c0_g1~~TRINITY_DN5864_c0_g1_i5.p1  ORF type:complete len:365 (-),score=62.37 TRINITY_DN5864_c0_g1_i5:106-1200(-)